MKPSKKCIDLIKSFEGFFAKPYLCPANVPTIGYGTIRYPNGQKVKLTDSAIDEKTAENYLMHEVTKKALAVDAMANDAINQKQFDALVSFVYNCGENALRTSTLLRLVNENPNNPEIRTQFMRWNKADGKVLSGLTRRRKAEADLYFS